MRKHVLYIGIAILTLSSLPSCTTEPADEASDVSEVGQDSVVEGTEGLPFNEGAREGTPEDTVTPSVAPCGFAAKPGGVCFTIRNCGDYDIWRQVVRTDGGHTACFLIQPHVTLDYCLGQSRIAYVRSC